MANLLKILRLYQGIPSMDIMASPCFGGMLIVIPASWSTFSFLSSHRPLSSSSNKMSSILSTSTQDGLRHLKLMNMMLACVTTELREWCSWCRYANQFQRLYDKIFVHLILNADLYCPSCWNLYAVLAFSIWYRTLLTKLHFLPLDYQTSGT